MGGGGGWVGGGGLYKKSRALIFTVSAGRGLTSGSGQHVGETLPCRHHLWVLLVGEVLPDSQRSIVWCVERREEGRETGEKRGVVNAQRTGGRSFTSYQWKTATEHWFEEKTKQKCSSG